MILKSGSKQLDLSKPRVMGVLNVTPDSFSDGGEFDSVSAAVARFEQMAGQGADIIDIGGESTGPGSKKVSVEDELARIIPVIEAVAHYSDVWISCDTYKAEVAQAAIRAGANMINDVLAMRGDEEMADVLAEAGVPVCLMFSKDDDGRTTQKDVSYTDIIEYISIFFSDRLDVAKSHGIARDKIILDPGQGAFVSTDPKYSLEILNRLREFEKFDLPLLVGSSRKSFIGKVLNLDIKNRLEGSLACALISIMNGASIIRTHDVKETRRVMDMGDAVLSS